MNRRLERFNELQVLINELMSDQKLSIDRDHWDNQVIVKLRNERDEIQGRLQAIDHAYMNSQEVCRISGEEIRRLKAENAKMARKLDAATVINGRLKAVQSIVLSWLKPDSSLRAKVAIESVAAFVDDSVIVAAQDLFATDKSE